MTDQNKNRSEFISHDKLMEEINILSEQLPSNKNDKGVSVEDVVKRKFLDKKDLEIIDLRIEGILGTCGDEWVKDRVNQLDDILERNKEYPEVREIAKIKLGEFISETKKKLVNGTKYAKILEDLEELKTTFFSK